MTVTSQWIEIGSADGGRFDGYLALPRAGRGPGIVIIQEIFGVNGHIRSVVEQYALAGYVALAPPTTNAPRSYDGLSRALSVKPRQAASRQTVGSAGTCEKDTLRAAAAQRVCWRLSTQVTGPRPQVRLL